MANSIRVTMVATGLTNQSGLENEPADVMKSYDNVLQTTKPW